jgi:hypothetical protein
VICGLYLQCGFLQSNPKTTRRNTIVVESVRGILKHWISRIGAAVFERSILTAIIFVVSGMGLAPAWSQGPKPPVPRVRAAGQPLSEKAAEAFQSKLMELSSPASSSHKILKSIVVTDREVNSYLKYDRPAFLPPGVTNLVIHFKPEGIYGESNVNFDTVKPAQQSANDFGTKILASIFSGNQKVTALGKIASSNGTGKLTIQDVHVGSVALSDWLVNWLIQTYVESQYHVDLNKPFLLPANVTRIEFAPGKAIFVRGREKK